MSWRKWNIRAELEGVELKPYEKPKINLDVLAAQHGPNAFKTDYRALNKPPVETPRGKAEEEEPQSKAEIVAANQPKRYYVVY